MGDPPERSRKQFDGSQQQPPHDDFVLFLDENLHKCAPILSVLEQANIRYKRHTDIFEPGVLDEVWLPKVCQHGWIVLTKDKGIRYNELEIRAIISNKGREFVFTSGNLSGAQMAEILSKALPKIQRLSQRVSAPFIASITQKGEVHVRYDENGSVYEQRRKARSK
ncbi:MAG: hypothetical protein LAP13_25715 [Acidobacteriia bacterium]|nr:hypothetical protein [Terriglobia bacterium]